MAEQEVFLDLKCPACDRTQLVGKEEMLQILRTEGKFRRDVKPKSDTVIQLFESTAASLSCSQCNHEGLTTSPAELDDDWGDAVCCQSCREVLDPDRLEIFPDAKYCPSCQKKSDAGELDQVVDYCPRCGSIMKIQSKGGSGLAQYVLRCGSCGYR